MNKIITRHRVMEILWLAIVLYSVGLGLVLHFRPALMFQENGAWKEFGYQRSPRHTLFPFWLFAVTWAFISYVIATSVSWVMPVGAAVAYSNGIESTFMSTPADEEEDEEMLMDRLRVQGDPGTFQHNSSSTSSVNVTRILVGRELSGAFPRSYGALARFASLSLFFLFFF
jgi:hypothetical protein